MRLLVGISADDRDLLYKEQVEKFGNPDGTFRPISYEDTKEMPVMDSIIRETLRMVSATPLLALCPHSY